MNIVYSKLNCPYCVMAKTLLNQKSIAFEEKIVGVDVTREQLLEAVPNAKTVPQIFLNGELIGGYEQLRSKLD